jgi:hypothetical protein
VVDDAGAANRRFARGRRRLGVGGPGVDTVAGVASGRAGLERSPERWPRTESESSSP